MDFLHSAIELMKDTSDGNTRRFLKIAFALMKSAAQQSISVINEDFWERKLKRNSCVFVLWN